MDNLYKIFSFFCELKILRTSWW